MDESLFFNTHPLFVSNHSPRIRSVISFSGLARLSKTVLMDWICKESIQRNVDTHIKN